MSLWTKVFGAPSQAQLNAEDTQLMALNEQLIQTYPDNYDANYLGTAQADIAKGNQSTGADNVDASISGEFAAGAAEGLNNVVKFPGLVVGKVTNLGGDVLGGILKNIPIWIWVGLLFALFVWMGGLELLRGRLANK